MTPIRPAQSRELIVGVAVLHRCERVAGAVQVRRHQHARRHRDEHDQPRHGQPERHQRGRAEGRRRGQRDGDDTAPVALAERRVQHPDEEHVDGDRYRHGEGRPAIRGARVVGDLVDGDLEARRRAASDAKTP